MIEKVGYTAILIVSLLLILRLTVLQGRMRGVSPIFFFVVLSLLALVVYIHVNESRESLSMSETSSEPVIVDSDIFETSGVEL